MMDQKLMNEICLEAGLRGTRFLRAVTRAPSAWGKIDGPMFYSFLRLAQLELVADLVRFEPWYDPTKGLLAFRSCTNRSANDEPVNNIEIAVTNSDAIDEYKQYLLEAIQAYFSKRQRLPTLEEALETYYPMIWRRLSLQTPIIELLSANIYAAV